VDECYGHEVSDPGRRRSNGEEEDRNYAREPLLGFESGSSLWKFNEEIYNSSLEEYYYYGEKSMDHFGKLPDEMVRKNYYNYEKY
jgi:hypothetical protein